MKTIIALFFCSYSLCSIAQQGVYKNNIKLTAGRILFGTGDVVGYGVNLEYSRPFLKSKHFLAGAELSFEDGTKRPRYNNITGYDFFIDPTFAATSNIVLTPKLTYYPFTKTFLKGVNITGGLSVGYTNQSSESYAHYEPLYGPTGTRNSMLEYINEAIFGYRITAGYEWGFRKFLAGARLDFDNYTNGDINTLVGLKAGYRF